MTYSERVAQLSEDEQLVWAVIAARARQAQSRTVAFDIADRFHDRYAELGLWVADGQSFTITKEAFVPPAPQASQEFVDLSESLPEQLLRDALAASLPRGMVVNQQTAIMTDRAEYRADFVLRGTGNACVVVEVDSVRHHGDDDHMLSDRQRDRAMAARGILTLRFMASEVLESPAMCAFEATEIAKVWLRREEEAA